MIKSLPVQTVRRYHPVYKQNQEHKDYILMHSFVSGRSAFFHSFLVETEKIMEEKEVTGLKTKIKNYFACFKLDTRSIASNAIIAARYTALTYAFFFCSYGPVQVRISEFRVLLVFFNPNYIYGLTIGCILSNIYAPARSSFCSPLDIAIGTAATIVALFLISWCRHRFVATLFPAITNGLLLSWEFTFITNTEGNAGSVLYWTNFGFVALGEIIAVSIIGYWIFYFLAKKNKGFLKLIDAKQNLDFKW